MSDKNKATAQKNDESDSVYCPENIALYEMLYGKNLISLGGLQGIENMFSGLKIRNLKALDVGFGLGGVAFHLAKQYQMQISGVEMQPWMVEHAKTQAAEAGIEDLEFNIYTAQGEIPYPQENFDIVYSKGVLNHVREKVLLFSQIYKVLKSHGLFVIADWLYTQKKEEDLGPLVCETQETYTTFLRQTGFEGIEFRDDSKAFQIYVEHLMNNLSNHQENIIRRYGHEMFDIILKQHQETMAYIQKGHKRPYRIVARKI